MSGPVGATSWDVVQSIVWQRLRRPLEPVDGPLFDLLVHLFAQAKLNFVNEER